jgi:hypothetical protein
MNPTSPIGIALTVAATTDKIMVGMYDQSVVNVTLLIQNVVLLRIRRYTENTELYRNVLNDTINAMLDDLSSRFVVKFWLKGHWQELTFACQSRSTAVVVPGTWLNTADVPTIEADRT